MTERLELQFKLACSPGHAFRVFTEMTDLWWPPGHKRHADSAMVFEPGPAGRLIERSKQGDDAVGEVVDWQPPNRLAFNWWLGAAEHPTRVEIGFIPADSGTAITILHTPGDADGDGIWSGRVARFEAGWTAVFSHLARTIEQEGPSR